MSKEPKHQLPDGLEAVTIGELDFVRHNPTDYEAFRDFTARLKDRYDEAHKANRNVTLRKNVEKWLQQVPERWRRARLERFDPTACDSDKSCVTAARTMLRNKQKGIFIAGPYTSGKSYLAYSIILKFVVHGKLKPSQIKVITESDLLAYATGGFKTQSDLEELFDPRYKCYLFDDLGVKKEYDARREAPALARFIEEVYNRSALFICTSYMDLELYASGLPEQTAAKLTHMMKDGVIYTGQPLYAKDDERNAMKLDVALYNLKRKLKFEELEEEPEEEEPVATKAPSWKSKFK